MRTLYGATRKARSRMDRRSKSVAFVCSSDFIGGDFKMISDNALDEKVVTFICCDSECCWDKHKIRVYKIVVKLFCGLADELISDSVTVVDSDHDL